MKALEVTFFPELGPSVADTEPSRLPNAASLISAIFAKISEWRKRSQGRANLASLDTRFIT